MGHDREERQRRMDDLLRLYGSGTGRFARYSPRLRALRKKVMWNAVIWFSRALKRGLDIAGALVGLTLFSPVMALAALLILMEDGRPVIFSQIRVGRHGRTFRMYKFRSMVKNAEELQGSLEGDNEAGDVLFKIRRDPRLTRVGAVLRRSSMDELPQFANVLLGDMSLVGPRPPTPAEVARYDYDDRVRLRVAPGITCLWQISGRSRLTFKEQVALDRQYVESQSFWQDVLILLRTIPAVLSGKGAY